jgi:hypothetical protein
MLFHVVNIADCTTKTEGFSKILPNRNYFILDTLYLISNNVHMKRK